MMPYSLRLSKGWEKVAFLPAGYTSLLQVICPRRPTCTGNHQAADGCRLHGNCTPPRISPSCPHCVKLWLGRSTIICGQDHCEAACQSCFWMDGYRSSPCWAVFIQKICTGGLRASSASLFHFWLIRLMSFSRWICTFQAARGGLKMSPQCIGHGNDFFIRSFEKFF